MHRGCKTLCKGAMSKETEMVGGKMRTHHPNLNIYMFKV